MHPDLFQHANTHATQAETIRLQDADLILHRHFFPRDEADALLRQLLQQVHWKQERIHLYGKDHAVPRLTAWHADQGHAYAYSGIHSHAQPWSDVLLGIKRRVETVAATTFNSVLLNLYRDGHDSVAWHSDDEPELGHHPTIASLSFGEERVFRLKHKRDASLKRSVILDHGSLLIMRGPTQANWLHQIPKSAQQLGPRVNLTFRIVR